MSFFLPLQQPKFDCVANVTTAFIILLFYFYYFLYIFLHRILNYRNMAVSSDPKEIGRTKCAVQFIPLSPVGSPQTNPMDVFGGIC